MYNRNFRGNSSRRPQAGNSRPGERRNFFGQGGGQRKKFTGSYIDINRFIAKAAPATPQKAYVSQHKFSDFDINGRLKYVIEERGFKHPTAIQDKAIPHILKGSDVIGLADTGTGKTGAFLIPMIHKIMENHQEKLLVVAPTRELAIQIQEEFLAFTRGINKMTSVVVVGGTNIQPQISRLKSNCSVVIGTPGRLKDLIQRRSLNLSHFNNIVLDEADRMLDMGFINDVRFLLSLMSEKRQTLLFSATLSPEIEQLIKTFLNNPTMISVKTAGASLQVDQDIVRMDRNGNKIEVLHNLITQTEFQKVLIFTRTKHGAEKLSKNLYLRGFKAESIHGDKSHGKRQQALKMFKEDRIEILVATDVAARGLDIPDVSHVINYDIPATFEDYIHRIGRTGRAGKTGKALTFVE